MNAPMKKIPAEEAGIQVTTKEECGMSATVNNNADGPESKPTIDMWGRKSSDVLAASTAYMLEDLAKSSLVPNDFPVPPEPMPPVGGRGCYKLWYSKEYYKLKVDRDQDKYIGMKGITPPIVTFGEFYGAKVSATVEGLKKALCFYLTTGIPTIGIDSCWGFGEHIKDDADIKVKELHSDIMRCLQPGCLHLVFFDGDWATNDNVKLAQAVYIMLLEEQGVKFQFKDLSIDGNKQGYDDWFTSTYGADRNLWPDQDMLIKSVFRDIGAVPMDELLGCSSKYFLNDLNRFSKEYLDLSDRGASSLIVKLIGVENFKYIADIDTWVQWQNGKWKNLGDFPLGLVNVAAQYYLRRGEVLAAQAAKMEGKDELKAKMAGLIKQSEKFSKFGGGHCSSTAGRSAVLRDLATRDGVRASATDFDTIPYLLGVANGVVDLRTGELRQEQQEDMLLRHCNASFTPECPPTTFEVDGKPRDIGEFVANMTGHPRDPETQVSMRDPELAVYHQQRTGAALWGTNALQGLDIWAGPRATAKSTFLQMIRGALGDTKQGGYFAQLSAAVILSSVNARNPEAATPMLMLTQGARIIGMSETKDTQVFNETLIKQLTGDMTINGRGNYQDGGDIKVTFNAIIVANDIPACNTSDTAFLDRVCVTPFEVRYKRDIVKYMEDANLPHGDPWWVDESHSHPVVRDYVLWYLVQGCVAWKKNGRLPQAPARVVNQLEDYIQENDVFIDWMSECGWVFNGEESTLSGDLYRSFSEWMLRSGRKPPNNKAFSKRLLKRFPKELRSHKGTGNTNHIWGISLKVQ
jgi:putative DNA primase/helicase